MNNVYTFPAKTIDQRPSLKVFPLADILSLSSGLMLSSPARLHVLIGYVTETDESRVGAHAKDAKECLEAQLPFLKTVDYTALHTAVRRDTAKMAGHLEFWLGAQARIYGGEHNVMPIERWQRRKNSHKL